ncbi:MAG: hypothetical protein AB1758_13025 [Candidatus Eremiobacterota bacterium]
MSPDEARHQARISQAGFGRVNGVFGLHVTLVYPSQETGDYTLTDLRHIEQFMDSLGASMVQDLVGRKLRLRCCPVTV